jgi:hypothetical protein
MPSANSRYMGANIEGKARRFLPYLGPEGVGGYRRICAEIAEKGYQGFVFASQGQGGSGRGIETRVLKSFLIGYFFGRAATGGGAAGGKATC